MSALGIPIEKRVKLYIDSVEAFIAKAAWDFLPKEQKAVIELAKSYLSDAKYYYEKGDLETSLSCIAYAEGLLDSLRIMGYIKGVHWEPISKLLKRPRVLVAGSFEFLHPGHINLLQLAWQHGEVYVVVSRDKNFEKFKGRKPALSERDRLEVVKSVRYVSSAIIGDEEDFLKPVVNIKPDIVVLGPDQWITPSELTSALMERGLDDVKVLKIAQRVGSWSSTSIFNDLRKMVCLSGSDRAES
ncbi:MAG: DUF357 domain-containing protein [Desulfurococcaceae archaeon]